MGQKDIISKQLIQRIAVDLAVYLLGLPITADELELLATEQQRVEDRRADVVAKVKRQAHCFILHIEIQNNNDPVMALRMLRYYTDVCFAYPDIPVQQYLIYIGAEKLSMLAHKKDDGLDYRYTIIDMHDIDYQDLLGQDSPDAMVLAILGDFKQHSKRDAVNRIVRQLHQKLEFEPKRFREYLSMMEILSENRDLKPYIKEAETMITQFDIEKLPSFELGLEKGIKQGMEQGIEQGMEQGIEQGIQKIVKQLLKQQPPETVAKITDLPIELVMAIKNKAEH